MINKSAIVISILLLALFSFQLYQFLTAPKLGYILIQDVYNDFDMKKEKVKEYEKVKNSRDKILDSLSLELKILDSKIQSEEEKNKETIKEFHLKREYFFEKKQMFEEDNEVLSKKYDQEILTQLNQYVKDYSIAKGYTYMFGNDGNGALMYGKDENNVTKDVINFINLKYKGL